MNTESAELLKLQQEKRMEKKVLICEKCGTEKRQIYNTRKGIYCLNCNPEFNNVVRKKVIE